MNVFRNLNQDGHKTMIIQLETTFKGFNFYILESASRKTLLTIQESASIEAIADSLIVRNIKSSIRREALRFLRSYYE